MRIAICDDNLQERARYSALVKEVAEQNDYNIELAEFANAKQLLFEMEDQPEMTDVLLMDINMPEINGIQAADKLRAGGYTGELVFLTVSRDYMLNAFDLHAYNYIVKGMTQEDKARTILANVMLEAEDKKKEYMLFTGVGEYRNIPLSSIRYFEVNGKIVTVHYGKDQFEFVSTIGKLENLLFTKGFIRIHKSFMISKASIKRFNYKEVELMNGTKLPVGRKYFVELKNMLKAKSAAE